MENKGTSCRAGKTTLVDPNKFYGQNSSNNIFVPLEDLSIYVQLETQRKSRTILTSEGKGKSGKSSSDVRIKFIEGSNVEGKKVLTTKFTDLTTSFDSISNEEGLGITGIDIDFNSAYAPLITINFVDIRGTSIFQNEDKLKEGKNKYSVFFQLPYPLYTLTVKGYYGMPVSYCLHMTKWTSRFNSQTGNFEITASFIGYTYAMLSDLLIGYLKVINHTQLGKEMYESLDPKVPSLNQLMKLINDINESVKKISADDPDAVKFARLKDKKENLETLKTNLYIFGSDLDVYKDFETYPFVIIDSKNDKEKAIKSFNNNVKEVLALYNADGFEFPIDEKQVTDSVAVTKIVTRTIKDIKENKPVTGQKVEADFNTALLSYLNSKKYDTSLDTKSIDVYDLRNIYKLISEKNVEVSKEEERLQKKLAQSIRATISKTIGFDPTVRNLINVFTTAAEIFLSILYKVSVAAKTNPLRTKELSAFSNISQSYDYPDSVTGDDETSDNYFPWPEYREKTEKTGLVEEYLGKEGVLDNPSNVDELNFIDDLLRAFLIGAREDELAQLELESQESNWFAANPLDTRLFGLDTFPYQRIQGNSYNEIVRLMMIRLMTFLFSNRKLRPEEIQSLATAELDSVLKYCINEKAIEALGQAIKTTFTEISGVINAENERVIQGPVTSIDRYYYNYIFGYSDISVINATSYKAIPINGPFEGNISPEYPTNTKTSQNLIELRDEGKLFLTNYTRSELASPTDKSDDGGTYIKMFTIDAYYNSALPTPAPKESSEIDFGVLKKDKNEFPIDGSGVGFSLLSGGFGVQEFFKMNWGDSNLTGLPFRYMFYENSNDNYNKSNGLGLKRIKSENSLSKIINDSLSKDTNSKAPTYSPFDINYKVKKFKVAEDWLEITRFIDDNRTNDSKRLHDDYGKTRELALKIKTSDDICYPFINFQVKDYRENDGSNLKPVSLFGSRFYYEQTSELSKALLFLHTFPWTGVMSSNYDGLFDVPEIYNTFGNRAGFISAPRLWAAFIGGLLWRADFTSPQYDITGKQIGGGSGSNDPILFYTGNTAFIPTLKTNSVYPSRWKYLITNSAHPKSPMVFDSNSNSYKELDDVLLGLPEQAKDEFKRVFFDFVQSIDSDDVSMWDIIKQNLEVINGGGAQWVSAYNTIESLMYKDPDSDDMVINVTDMNNVYNSNFNSSRNNYRIFTPLYGEPDFKYNFIAEINENSDANKMLLRLLDDEIIIANMSWKIWDPDWAKADDPYALRAAIYGETSDVDLYITTVLSKLNEVKDRLSASDKKKQREQEIFGTSDENLIKLQLYRTCKNIYDKWIGGSENEDSIIFQCGGRSNIDTQLADKYGNKTPKLIDSFRFVNRSFSDIGDKFVINPIPVNDYLVNNPNSSFYDVVTSLLSANNFDFIPLPTYINYNDPAMVEKIFQPLSTIESFNAGTVGPSFVCVYVGQKSKHLDTFDSNYPNDGFDFRCDKDGNLMPNVPVDFKTEANPHEDKVAVFAVNFSQQNQNIFKDITLDQSEFGETAESLQITDEIASKGAENNGTFGGQNMYNVYSVRSYKTEVEMMGNAMIQPMMYFQLNNIPMFHGAYLITHVKHNIKPNFMSTHFTGVRVREPETPLVDVSDIFMSLLDTIANSNVRSNEETNTIKNYGSKTSDITGEYKIPNTVSVDDLKNKININKFNYFKTIKFTQYGNKQ